MLGRFGGLSKKGEKRAVVDDVLSAAWLPNGQQLVTGTPGGELLIWDIHGVCVKVWYEMM
jgi:WD40 repeat protein